jgi:hypothetical protein
MSRMCIVGAVLFFILFIMFLAISLYVFNLSLSLILKYKTVSHINMTDFLIDSAISVSYLLLSLMLLLVAGILLYGTLASLLYCRKDSF